MNEYQFTLENIRQNIGQLEPLYRQHYGEMKARLAEQGIEYEDYNPRYKQYFEACDGGWLLNFVIRYGGEPVGYSNIYLTNDMHNGALIAREDTIYVLPGHRNGVGRRFSKAILEDLRARGVRRLHALSVTDPRVAKLWTRMGFKLAGQAMIYTF